MSVPLKGLCVETPNIDIQGYEKINAGNSDDVP